MVTSKIRSKALRHPFWTGLITVVVLGIIAITILEITNVTYFFHSRHLVTGGQYTKAAPSNGNTHQDNSNQNQNSKGSDQSKSPSPNVTTTVLLSPTGDFVSAHHQNLADNPSINSVCNTTPGALCTIVFTQGSTSKSLPAQLTDQGGATYWTWHLQDIGLTTGNWNITAKATLGSQTQTASDALQLEVTE